MASAVLMTGMPRAGRGGGSTMAAVAFGAGEEAGGRAAMGGDGGAVRGGKGVVASMVRVGVGGDVGGGERAWPALVDAGDELRGGRRGGGRPSRARRWCCWRGRSSRAVGGADMGQPPVCSWWAMMAETAGVAKRRGGRADEWGQATRDLVAAMGAGIGRRALGAGGPVGAAWWRGGLGACGSEGDPSFGKQYGLPFLPQMVMEHAAAGGEACGSGGRVCGASRVEWRVDVGAGGR